MRARVSYENERVEAFGKELKILSGIRALYKLVYIGGFSLVDAAEIGMEVSDSDYDDLKNHLEPKENFKKIDVIDYLLGFINRADGIEKRLHELSNGGFYFFEVQKAVTMANELIDNYHC
jgi:hypothetical protein